MFEMEIIAIANASLEELCELYGVDPEELTDEKKSEEEENALYNSIRKMKKLEKERLTKL